MSAIDYRKVLLVAAIVVVLLTALFFASRWLEVDRCLDAGGRFDYEARRCELDASYPPNAPSAVSVSARSESASSGRPVVS